MNTIYIPADVPRHARAEYRKNMRLLTRGSETIFLFSADHKIEHLNDDFQLSHADAAAQEPRHLFTIAQQAPIGAMASHFGLIAQYGLQYPTIPYVIKLNGKTNIDSCKDPVSRMLWSVDDVVQLKDDSGLTILGVGITIYLGSDYEDQMLEQTAQTIYAAHRHGLIAIVWIYPRGHAVTDETDPHLSAGAAGVALSLGADVVKIHAPQTDSYDLLHTIVAAAGTTKVLSAGGSFKEQQQILDTIGMQRRAGFSGIAMGRSLFQRSLQDALTLSEAISRILR